MSDKKNYILEVRVKHRGGRAKYARSGHCGYTNNLEDAGRFTKEEADHYVIGQESKYEAKPFAKPDTVTISRECAERSHVRASYYLQAAYNKAVGPEALKDFNELTKALEVET